MCGIAGRVNFKSEAPIESSLIGRMCDLIAHRGPDGDGSWVDGFVGFGHRRLAIIDLSPAGRQPMSTASGDVWITFNGEIYNFQELRLELESKGHHFRTRTDTEVLLAAYQEYGVACLSKLRGMFAFALWDRPRRRLFIARDRLGKKPLHYFVDKDGIAFASEPKAFLADPAFQPRPSMEAIAEYLTYQYVPSPLSAFEGVAKLPPAHYLVVEDGKVQVERYWKLSYRQKAALSEDDACEGLIEKLREAVRLRLISDVPLGAFLSGGIDSTIVVGVMSQLTSAPVKTFSIGFEGDAAYDETAYARMAAERFKTEHTEFRVAPSALDLIDTLIWHHDGPFGDSSAVPTYIVSKLAREHVTVVLTGDGGDEVFAGYRRFAAALISERLPSPAIHAARVLSSALPASRHDRTWWASARRFVQAAADPVDLRVTRWMASFFDDLDALLQPEFRARVAPLDKLAYLAREQDRMRGLSTLSRLLHANFVSYLPDDLLVKTDRCTMANSLEARSPFLDRELIEFVARLPDDLKLRGQHTKVILREAFADLLPPAINRRGKMGFGVPVGAWFRGQLRDYVRDLLLAPNARYRDMLSGSFVENLVNDHLSGKRHVGPQLWTLICFEEWLRLLPAWTSPSAQAVPALR